VRWIARAPLGVTGRNLLQTSRQLASAMELPQIVAELLARRGIASADEARRFLHPSLDHLHSPMEMLGMLAAVERLERAIAQREPMLIYGDYDVDGTMATVILKTVVELLGGQCDFHVPHRLLEGYGMRDEVIERAAANGIKLIISVDTGIRAFAAAETAARVGVDLIVTDHHLVAQSEGIPKALAVLNPNQSGCSYPCKDLCGAGSLQGGAGIAGARRTPAADPFVSESCCHCHHRRLGATAR
jgi:single-stranded-DNA-specific exonuclease